MPRSGPLVVVEVSGANGSRGGACPSDGSIRDARLSRWRRRAGRGSIVQFVRWARRPSRSALICDWHDAEAAARFRPGIHACPACRLCSPSLSAWSGRRSTTEEMSIQSVHRRNQCHAPEEPSMVENRCWMRVGAAASALGWARMMHYPGGNDSARDHPGVIQGRSAGDRGVDEAWGGREMRWYGESVTSRPTSASRAPRLVDTGSAGFHRAFRPAATRAAGDVARSS